MWPRDYRLQRSRRPRTTERCTRIRCSRRRRIRFNEAVVRGRRRGAHGPPSSSRACRFNEAVVRGRRRVFHAAASLLPNCRLQRSRRPRTTERRGRPCPVCGGFDASTKPSSEDDGESLPRILWTTRWMSASTKPSSEDDGEPTEDREWSLSTKPLQRSRRPRTTERCTSKRTPRGACRCFNEAVVRGRRRAPSSACASVARRTLQRSRRPRTTESPACPGPPRRAPRGFNEAVVRGRRRAQELERVPHLHVEASTKPSSEDDGEGRGDGESQPEGHPASTKPSSEDDGEFRTDVQGLLALFMLQRSRRPRTTESGQRDRGIGGQGLASTKPSSEDDGERRRSLSCWAFSVALQRSRRPRTTERSSTQRHRCFPTVGFNEAVVRGRRRGPARHDPRRLGGVASTKPSSEDDGEILSA